MAEDTSNNVTDQGSSNKGSLDFSDLEKGLFSGYSKDDSIKPLDKVLKEFNDWDEVNTAVWNSCNNGKPPMGVSVESVDGCINAVINTVQTVDKFGKALAQGGKCMVCGKTIHYVPLNGYCSVQCFAKDLMKRIAFGNKSKSSGALDKLLESIQSALDFLDIVINLITELPEKLKDLATIPPEFRNFLQIRINIIFLQIKILINKIMIFKNNCIIEILKPLQLGVINDKIALLLPAVNAIITTVQALITALDSTFGAILAIMQNPMFSISPESYVWAMTPRSIIRQPALYIEVPPPLNGPFAPLSMLNVQAIAKTVQGLFPPITPIEYFMEPEWFDIRLALSDQSDIVKQFIETLEMILKFGPEYLPRYKDLKITNPWFIAAILLGWAPKAQIAFGSFINPYA